VTPEQTFPHRPFPAEFRPARTVLASVVRKAFGRRMRRHTECLQAFELERSKPESLCSGNSQGFAKVRLARTKWVGFLIFRRPEAEKYASVRLIHANQFRDWKRTGDTPTSTTARLRTTRIPSDLKRSTGSRAHRTTGPITINVDGFTRSVDPDSQSALAIWTGCIHRKRDVRHRRTGLKVPKIFVGIQQPVHVLRATSRPSPARSPAPSACHQHEQIQDRVNYQNARF